VTNGNLSVNGNIVITTEDVSISVPDGNLTFGDGAFSMTSKNGYSVSAGQHIILSDEAVFNGKTESDSAVVFDPLPDFNDEKLLVAEPSDGILIGAKKVYIRPRHTYKVSFDANGETGTMEDGTGLTVMNYNYLCCTDDEIKTTHTPESAVSFPPCTDGSYNYYKINGMYYENWDRDVIYNALMASVQNGESAIVMKFGTQEAYDTAKYELFTNRLYYDADQYLMQVNGVSSWNNRYSMDDEFRVITIQWL
jgi:hypothetical protein